VDHFPSVPEWYTLSKSLDAEFFYLDFCSSLTDCLKYSLRPLVLLIVNVNSMNWNPVYKLVKKVPRGRVTTYGAIARALKLPGGARTAGRAMAACPSGRGIPWHRVVGAGGTLLLREPNVSLQRRLLESEGLQVSGRHIANFEAFNWTPGRKKRRFNLSRI
jgi:methylated-DNA-protein-cysteine methyltransferase-like protein